MCCGDIRTDAIENSSKLLDTEGRPDKKLSDARELNYIVLNLAQSLLESS